MKIIEKKVKKGVYNLVRLHHNRFIQTNNNQVTSMTTAHIVQAIDALGFSKVMHAVQEAYDEGTLTLDQATALVDKLNELRNEQLGDDRQYKLR